MSKPRRLSSRYIWQREQRSQQQWTRQSAQGSSVSPSCARRQKQVMQPAARNRMLNNSSWRKELPSESRGGLGSITVGAVVAAATEAGGPSAARRSLDLESAGGGRHRQAHRRWWQRVVGVGRRRRWRVVGLRLFGCIHGGRALDQLRDGRRRGLGDYLESISVLSHCYRRSKRKKGGRRGQGKILGSKGSDIPPNAAAEGDKKGPEEEKGGVGGREEEEEGRGMVKESS
ncbi:hypothetical protein BHE74_00037585 [Ensete ventricosum]|nr:hypothetical protein BHE74_00037585 [Ensete ventricosum]